jgi:hypothetical protein
MALTIEIPKEATSRKPVPVILLIDVSSSMHPLGIAEANTGVQNYIEEMQQNEETRDSVFFSLVTFSDSAKVLVDHQPIRKVRPPILSAENSTRLSVGLSEVLSLVSRHQADFKGGKEPLFFLITDGNPNSDDGWGTELQRLNDNPFVGRRPSGRWAGYRVCAGAGNEHEINDAVLEAFRHDVEKSQVIRLRGQGTISSFFRHLVTLTVEFAEGKPLTKIVGGGAQAVN